MQTLLTGKSDKLRLIKLDKPMAYVDGSVKFEYGYAIITGSR